MNDSIADTSQAGIAQATGELAWSFTLSSDQISLDEQDRFDADLAELGLERSIWAVYNAVLKTGTKHSRPLAVRAFENDALVGIALVYECRKSGECFFDPPVSTLFDFPGLPMFVWLRYGVTVDHIANPGFVVAGISRALLIEKTIKYLLERYLMGTVIEYAPTPKAGRAATFPFVDTGVIDLNQFSNIEAYTARGKNLNRKRKKFGNKGGEVRVIEGALPDVLRNAALDAFGTLDIMVRTPFQDNYLNMVRSNMSLESPAMVHFVALLDGEYAGHQSFCRSGNQIFCQAGAFDRRRKSTYHAYENIIIRSVEFALEHGLNRIDYGPVLNETKAKMMTGYIQCENRTYTRYRPMAAAMPLLMNRSKISPHRLEPWVGLGETTPVLAFS